jgi:hypothetical protein
MVPHLLPISREKATVEAHEVSICLKLLAIHSLIIEALVGQACTFIYQTFVLSNVYPDL